MEIRTIYGLEHAGMARGIAVVIDVFRAFSTACYLFANGAKRVVPIASLEEAFALKAGHPGSILMGERETRKVEGFDYGNSPAEIETVDFTGKTVFHATTHGTCGVVAAFGQAEEVITGSFVNAASIVEYLKQRKADVVSLVALAPSLLPPEARPAFPDDEDSRCAAYLAALLEGEKPAFSEICEDLRKHKNSEKFFDAAKPWTPPRDFELCMQLDRFGFVLRAEKSEDGLITLRKVEPAGNGFRGE